MNLRLSDLDPLVAAAITERVSTLWKQWEQLSPPEKTAAETIQRRVDRASRWFNLFDWALPALTFFGGPFLGVALWHFNPGLGVAAGAGASVAFGGVFWRVCRLTDPRKHLEEYILREEMNTLFPLLKLTPVERAYCDALLGLAGLDGYVDAETARGMLRQWNELLASDRELAARRAEVKDALAVSSAAGLSSHEDELHRQAKQTTDPQTREALAHSIQMCAARIENAQNFDMTLGRLDAQREAILQSFASLHSSLIRIRLAPQNAAPDVGSLQQSLTELNTQTRSVELAVQEVMALRSGN